MIRESDKSRYYQLPRNFDATAHIDQSTSEALV